MSQWKAWILAARPKTLPAAIVPVWSGSLLAYEQTGSFHLSLALLTVFGAISILKKVLIPESELARRG